MAGMDITRLLRFGALGTLFVIPFVPLIVANEFFFPFITGKNFAFRILVELGLVFFALLALYDTSIRPRVSSMLVALSLLVLTMGISTILSENPMKSFWSNFERMEGYIGLLHLFAYFLIATSFLSLEKHFKTLINITIGVSVLVGFYGLLQLGGALTINQGGVRVDATLGNATYLAVYMLFHIFLTLLAYVRWGIGRGKELVAAFYGSALILQVVMLFYASTRGTILGLIGGLFVSGLVYALSPGVNERIRKIGIASVISVLVVAAGFFALKDTSFVQNHQVLQRIANISLETGETRFTIWGMAYQGFLERPIFGWGQESFNFVFNKYYDASLYTEEPWFDRAHNAFIDWLVAGGAPAFLLYISLYGIALFYLFRRGNPFTVVERGIFSGLIAAYAFHNLFVFDNLLSSYLFMTVLAYLTVRTMGESNSVPIEPTKTFYAGAPVIAVLGLVLMYFVNVPGIVTATSIIEGIKPHAEGLSENLRYFDRALANNGLGRQEAREHLAQFAVQLRSLSVPDQSFIAEVDKRALLGLEEEVRSVPNDTRTLVFLGSLHRQMGNPNAARPYLERALENSPQKLAIMFELGVLESSLGNREKALEWLKKAYDLAPEYDLARSLYASALIQNGAYNLAEPILIEQFGTVTPNDANVLAAYLSVRDFGRVLTIAEGRLAESPDNPRYHIDLASVYLEMGRRSDAISKIREAIALDASFKDQGEYFIKEIEAGRTP